MGLSSFFKTGVSIKDDNAEMAKVVHGDARCGRQNNNSLKMSTPEFTGLYVIVYIKRDLAILLRILRWEDYTRLDV